jgi:hypothetical protein
MVKIDTIINISFSKVSSLINDIKLLKIFKLSCTNFAYVTLSFTYHIMQ